jgi:1L-myo-inositol 1-phosphate cytidylyltransferase
MKCLIVAAGQGARLREKGELKPLIPIKGVPLIEHVISRARSAGIDEFLVVSGYRGEELRRELDTFSAREKIRITHVVNDDWNRANGVSLLKAKRYLDEPFLLTMCDHLIDPEIFRSLMSESLEPDTVTLGVYFNIDSPLNDPEDVTRVKCSDGRIEHIGKVIREFNALDTGVFLCAPIIFDALEESQARGDDSISGAMNVLARWNKARAFDIQNRLWVDVDDPVAFHKAEGLLESGQL